VQVELAALETAGAGWPPEIHTRHFIVQGGTVLLCEGLWQARRRPARVAARPGSGRNRKVNVDAKADPDGSGRPDQLSEAQIRMTTARKLPERVVRAQELAVRC